MADSSSSAQNVDAGEDENTMTLVDFLEEEQQLESDADAVLGPSDDKNCTYNLGYVPRQALYACITCTPQDAPDCKPAGICLACSYDCHEGHELIELYTKRLFRCDCGNSQFQGRKCNLVPEKCELNEKNVYNHNFKGVYCTCGRPYPDPEEEHSDDMHQCIICEDWYHTKHLNSPVPPDQLYAEMICGLCTDRLSFLNHYLSHAVTNETQIVDVVGIDKNSEADTAKNEMNGELQNAVTCYLKSHEAQTRPLKSATFWPNDFRKLLCSCTDCKSLYTQLDVPWILDENDTVHAYEAKGKQGVEVGGLSRYEKGMKALSQLGRVQQVEAIQNYNELKENLSEYLSKFVENKKVVRKEDIYEFFSQMNARKRQRIGTPPYMCH
uniref:Putative e3 ubiquitin-protein ligase ubr7 n=1 Tax=Triatoma dimidiata TaxID=72491 RepID=A0A0V0G494_TRIDM